MSKVLSEKDLADIAQEVRDNTICPPRFGAYIISLLMSHRALQRRVEWTKERPNKEGYYWIKKTPTDFRIVLVVVKDGHFGVYMDYAGFKKVEYVSLEWAFIEPPHEARG